ncbi:gamma-glutamylcyclotransferase family protein [Halodurantibacterium flavum]|uniref:Gamma-glutamylcyclotransferase family protein n=1 Tax=Halodurantibacterium flavum TaxID=1382802 RepID=A0ABW4SBQ8_9RHOB
MSNTRRAAVRVLLILALLLAVALIGIRHAPIYLPRIEAEHPEPGAHRVFGYATLTNPLVRFVVVGHPVPSRPAALDGFTRDGRDLIPAPGSGVEGRVFEVDAVGLRRLDRYEYLGQVYDRVEMPLQDGSPAWVYLMRGDVED